MLPCSTTFPFSSTTTLSEFFIVERRWATITAVRSQTASSMAICTLLAVFLFGVPLRGSVFALFAVSTVFLVPALGQGLLISAAAKNQFVASQFALLSAFLPA